MGVGGGPFDCVTETVTLTEAPVELVRVTAGLALPVATLAV